MIDPEGDRNQIYEVAHEEAVRALVEQRAAIDNIRTRAGILISVAAVVTSFLGGQALQGGLGLGSLVALAAFAGVAVTSLMVLWPSEEPVAAASPSKVIELYADRAAPFPIGWVHRELAYEGQVLHDASERLRQLLIRRFRTATALLGLEVAGWLVQILLRS